MTVKSPRHRSGLRASGGRAQRGANWRASDRGTDMPLADLAEKTRSAACSVRPDLLLAPPTD
jgi:hypothetical protein